MTDAERYAITVRKVCVDGEDVWRATVRELPDLAEFAETREEAIELAVDAIESLKASAAEEGREFPEPNEDEEEYSGRVTLRLPRYLHREIAVRAQEEDVSLNSYIVTNLAWNTAKRADTPTASIDAASMFSQWSVNGAVVEQSARVRATAEDGVKVVNLMQQQGAHVAIVGQSPAFMCRRPAAARKRRHV